VKTRSAGGVIAAAMTGCIILVGLGAWQLYRLQVKEALIADVESRLDTPSVSLDQAIAADEAGKSVEFLRVEATGVFQNGGELYVLTSEGEPGWRVVTPLKSETGAVVLVDRGFVPDPLRDPAKRPGSQPDGSVRVSGYASRHPYGQGLFVPDNDAAGNNWYWWDIPAMLAFGKIDAGAKVAPFVLHALPGSGGPLPRPSPPLLGISNNHLQYALTWFGLAVVLAIVAFVFVRRET
jgi:surfeit locus 1 family protein